MIETVHTACDVGFRFRNLVFEDRDWIQQHPQLHAVDIQGLGDPKRILRGVVNRAGRLDPNALTAGGEQEVGQGVDVRGRNFVGRRVRVQQRGGGFAKDDREVLVVHRKHLVQ